MSRLMKQRSRKAGLPPGTLVHIGDLKRETTSVTVFEYNEQSLREEAVDRLEEGLSFKDKATVKWINVEGLNQVELLEDLGNHFNLHPLVMEDILNTAQRPKVEDYGEYIYIVAKMLYHDTDADEIFTEQESLILGDGFVITIGERESEVFEPVRERLKNAVGRIRKMGADYLLYSLLDTIVDNYFTVLEKLGDKIEFTEERLIIKPTPESLRTIHHLKREMLFMHKSIWPLREVMSVLSKGDMPLILETTEVYIRDIYDHVIQAMDTTETFRDMLSGMLDIYLSSISNRMNEIMKVLTVISTIFIPLTFIVGVYGMNFKYMPELEWRWGYPAVMVLMGVSGFLMVNYFRKKKWM